MKVLLFDSFRAPPFKSGGSAVQLRETRRELEALGVQVVVPPEWPRDLSEFDLVHLTNLQTIEGGVDLLEAARSQRKPIALSPIWWDFGPADNSASCLEFSPSGLIRSLTRINPRWGAGFSNVRYIRGARRTTEINARVLRQVDLLLPNSVAELEILVQQYRLPQLRAKAVIVPNGITILPVPEPRRVAQFAHLPEEFVLQVASYHPVKGQARLISALMREKHLPIVCVGPSTKAQSPYREHCKKLAEQRGNTFLLDEVDYELMPWFYSRARVHVLPSLRESPGLASLEAAVYGARCVVGIHAPVSEYFGFGAVVCDPEKPASLRRSVQEAWAAPQSPDLRDRILRKFTWRRAAEETLRGYDWLLGPGSPRRGTTSPKPAELELQTELDA